tara:strand:+ start:80 stop:415 length:336 start_codon:yes stop_codon:yes gene_type:complete
MIKFPSTDLAEERRRQCKRWLIGLSAGLLGPIVLIFSFRQKRYEYLLVFIIIATAVIGIRTLYPEPPLSGNLFIPIVNWLFYSSYGPGVLHAYGAWNIADIIKKEAIEKIK